MTPVTASSVFLVTLTITGITLMILTTWLMHNRVLIPTIVFMAMMVVVMSHATVTLICCVPCFLMNHPCPSNDGYGFFFIACNQTIDVHLDALPLNQMLFF